MCFTVLAAPKPRFQTASKPLRRVCAAGTHAVFGLAGCGHVLQGRERVRRGATHPTLAAAGSLGSNPTSAGLRGCRVLIQPAC